MEAKELIRPSLKKVGFTFVIAVLIVIIILNSVPFISSTFNGLDITRKIIDVLVNAVIFSVIIYPWICIILELIKKKKR